MCVRVTLTAYRLQLFMVCFFAGLNKPADQINVDICPFVCLKWYDCPADTDQLPSRIVIGVEFFVCGRVLCLPHKATTLQRRVPRRGTSHFTPARHFGCRVI